MSAIEPQITRFANSFGSTIWIVGALLRAIMLCSLVALLALDPSNVWLYVAAILIDFIVLFFQGYRVFSQTQAYGLATGRFLTVLAIYAASIVAALLTVYIWWLVFIEIERNISQREFVMPEKSQVIQSKTVAESRRPQERYRVDISFDRKTLVLEGVMANGMMSAMDQILTQSPRLETVVLDSPGGDIFEARQFANRIQQYNLNTKVLVECSASCLIPFMAGQARTMGAGAKLGFHRYGLDFKQLRPYLDLESERIKDKAFFESRSISGVFMQMYMSEDRRALWYPKRSFLYDSGVITQN